MFLRNQFMKKEKKTLQSLQQMTHANLAIVRQNKTFFSTSDCKVSNTVYTVISVLDTKGLEPISVSFVRYFYLL